MDYSKKSKSIAFGFTHGSKIEQIDLPNDIYISIAGQNDRDEIIRIWEEIYNRFNLKIDDNIDEVNRTVKQYENGNIYLLRSEKTVLGLGCANFKYDSNGYIEIGYAIKPDFWNKGYATLLAKYLKYLCQSRNKKAIAHCDLNHTASLKVLVKTSMIPLHRKLEFTV
ncbi:MAG: GNAT family N-acetyltransferase [bacterium]|nr:GNAT family N-acetyltransferase [bacterium]